MNETDKIYSEFNQYLHILLAIMEEIQKTGKFANLTELSNSALSVLMCIPREGSRNYKQITEKLNIPKSTLTGVVKFLEKKGYIYQVVNEKDKRIHDLFLTDKGKVTQEEHDACEKETYAIVTGNLNQEEKTKLLSMLKKGLQYNK